MEMEWIDFLLGFMVGLFFCLLVLTVIMPDVQNNIATKVCESHDLELDYREGLDKIVCQEKPETFSNKRVFDFD